MAYDEQLAERMRQVLHGTHEVVEKKMFGGLAFMVRGHMSCGIVKDELMLRLGAAGAAVALKHPHVREMDFTGRPLTGMVYVSNAGIRTDQDLGRWVKLAIEFAQSLPPKKPKLTSRSQGRSAKA